MYLSWIWAWKQRVLDLICDRVSKEFKWDSLVWAKEIFSIPQFHEDSRSCLLCWIVGWGLRCLSTSTFRWSVQRCFYWCLFYNSRLIDLDECIKSVFLNWSFWGLCLLSRLSRWSWSLSLLGLQNKILQNFFKYHILTLQVPFKSHHGMKCRQHFEMWKKSKMLH